MSGLLQSSLIAGIVNKGISLIAETDLAFFLLKILGYRSCDGRGNVRTQDQSIALTVKELLQILGWGGSY